MTITREGGAGLREQHLDWTLGTDADRPSCPDCGTPAQSHAGRDRWVCGLCRKGFDGLNRSGLDMLSKMPFALAEALAGVAPRGSVVHDIVKEHRA